MKKPYPAIRWSLFRAAEEFRTTVNRIRKGLKARGVSPDSKNTYATHEIASAIYDRDDLEQMARNANFQRKIDEAATAKAQRDERAGKLVEMDAVSGFLSDKFTRISQT